MAYPSVTRKQAREVDRHAIEDLGFPGIVLMENAGRGCVDLIEQLGLPAKSLVVCGRGNNAGDGFVIARHLSLRGRECRVALAGDPDGLAGDALIAYQMLLPCRLPTLGLFDEARESIPTQLDHFAGGCPLLIDTLLGTGATGDPRPPYDTVIRWLNAQRAVRLAVDLPSGLDCDTGQPGEPTVRADHTCTFVAPKVGFGESAAAEYVGRVHVVSIGIPTQPR